MGRKRGRPAKHFETTSGETIVGLCRRADGRFVPVGRGDVSFGSDEALAIHRFRSWQANQTGELEPVEDPLGALTHLNAYKEHIRQLILTDPKQAALELNIPHLADYPVKPEKPKFTLVEVGDEYIAHKRNRQGKPLQNKHKKNSRAWWSEFLRLVGTAYARDITREKIRLYHDHVMEKYTNGKKSPAYVRSRFVQIKAILNWGLKYLGDEVDMRRALDVCKILESPEQRTDPNPIQVSDFHDLLRVARVRERAALMLGLNAAMHIGEVATTRLDSINMDARTLVARRSKNSQPRVAKLWPRTVEALRTYIADRPQTTDYIFVSRTGKPLTGESLRQSIVATRHRAGVPDTVTFEGLRDAAFTIAQAIDPHHAKFLVGHKTGISDNYVLRQADNPRVVECCEAIQNRFFPPTGKPDAGGGQV